MVGNGFALNIVYLFTTPRNSIRCFRNTVSTFYLATLSKNPNAPPSKHSRHLPTYHAVYLHIYEIVLIAITLQHSKRRKSGSLPLYTTTITHTNIYMSKKDQNYAKSTRPSADIRFPNLKTKNKNARSRSGSVVSLLESDESNHKPHFGWDRHEVSEETSAPDSRGL